MKTFQDEYNAHIILHIMHFTGNQTVQGPKDSFSANCSKGFKQFQTMNNVDNFYGTFFF